MTAEVQNVLKDRQPCPCTVEECTVYGRLLKSGHVRGCSCRPCLGGRSRRSGVDAQRGFQKAAGIKQSRFRGINGNEEGWRDYWLWEIKSGAQVRPVATAYRRCRAQIEANRSIGDPRPAAVGVSADGLRLVVVTAEDWAMHVAPLMEAP